MLPVRVQPRASREQILGWHDGRLKIALNAPPVEGAANGALCRLLAKALGVGKTAVQVIQGEKSREKLVRIQGGNGEKARQFRRQWQLPDPSG